MPMQEFNTPTKLIRAAEEGLLAVPIYQREYVWKRQQVADLYNFMLDSYDNNDIQTIPLSPILLATSENPKETSPVSFEFSEDEVSPQAFLVVDGFQRTMSLYRSKRGDFDDDLFYDRSEKHFVAKERVRQALIDNYDLIPVSIFFRTMEWNAFRNELSRNRQYELIDEMTHVRDKLNNFQITTQAGRNLSLLQQITWFNVVNSKGTKISGDDQIIAQATKFSLDIREAVNKVDRILHDAGLNIQQFGIHQERSWLSNRVLMLMPIVAERAPMNQDKLNFFFSRFNAMDHDKAMQEHFHRSLAALPVVFKKALDIYKEYLDKERFHKIRPEHLLFLVGFSCYVDPQLTRDQETLIDAVFSKDLSEMTQKELRSFYYDVVARLQKTLQPSK